MHPFSYQKHYNFLNVRFLRGKWRFSPAVHMPSFGTRDAEIQQVTQLLDEEPGIFFCSAVMTATRAYQIG